MYIFAFVAKTEVMRFYTKILLLLLSLFISNLFANEPDSIVFLKDLSFQTSYERDAFYSINISERPYYAHLLISSDSCSSRDFEDINRSISRQISSYSNYQKFGKLSDKKKIKKIYGEVHESFLNKYELTCSFNSLFKKGDYNCVTASAFYGIIFNQLGIPFSIKESFDHVYIVTYPETSSIIVESTDPQRGYYVYDERTKVQFVDFMKESKIISQDEFDQKSTSELFNEYYYREEEINLLQLVGVQYYNNAADYLEEEQYENAFKMAEKAYYLHPNDRIGYLLLIAAVNVLEDCNYTDIHYADYIYKVARYHKYGISNDGIRNEFIKLTHKLLISQYDTSLYDAYYHRIINNIDDTILSDEISFLYNYERGRILFNDNRYDLSMDFTERAYKLKPKHVDARKLFVGNVMANFSTLNNPEEALEQLNSYSQNYPDLMNNNNFSELRCTLLLGLSVESFASGNSKQGFDYIQTFEEVEKLYPINFNSYLINEAVIEAYSRAASHYFRRGNYTDAKHYLKQGLKYAPNSYELKNKLNSIN